MVAPADLPAAAAADRLAWWRIDPASGTALGLLKTGGGAELFETVYTYVNIASCALSGYGLISAVINRRIADMVVGLLTTGLCLSGMAVSAINARLVTQSHQQVAWPMSSTRSAWPSTPAATPSP